MLIGDPSGFDARYGRRVSVEIGPNRTLNPISA